MSLAFFKIILAIFILIITLISGIWPFLKKRVVDTTEKTSDLDYPVGESFATGIFLGAGLMHLLPEAAQDFTRAGYHYPYTFLIAGISFLFLLMLEHIGDSLKHKAHYVASSITLLTVTMLSIHSLLEGAAVGLATSVATTVIIAIAIIAHKGADSFASSMSLNRSQLLLPSRVIGFTLFALMTPLGIVGGNWILTATQINPLLTPIFSSLAAGTFLYIGTLHGLGRASLIRHCCNMREFFVMLFGFSVMAVVAIWT